MTTGLILLLISLGFLVFPMAASGSSDSDNDSDGDSDSSADDGDNDGDFGEVGQNVMKQFSGEQDDPEDDDDSGSDDSESDADDDPAEPNKDDSERATPGPKFDDRLLAIAGDFGLSREEALSFGSPDALKRVLTNVYERAKQSAASQAPSTQVSESEADAPFDLGLDPDEFTPEFISGINEAVGGVVSKLQDRIKTLEADNAKNAQVAKAAEHSEGQRQFDTAIGQLGSDFAEFLGKGETKSLDPESDEYLQRVKLSRRVSVLARGYTGSGEQLPSIDQLVKEAALIVFGDKLTTIARKQAVRNISDRSSRASVRPSHRKAGDGRLPERERTIKELEKMVSDWGART